MLCCIALNQIAWTANVIQLWLYNHMLLGLFKKAANFTFDNTGSLTIILEPVRECSVSIDVIYHFLRNSKTCHWSGFVHYILYRAKDLTTGTTSYYILTSSLNCRHDLGSLLHLILVWRSKSRHSKFNFNTVINYIIYLDSTPCGPVPYGGLYI